MRDRWMTAACCTALVAALGAAGVAFARELGSREARDAIAKLLGRSRSDVRIKSISAGLGGDDAVVTAEMDVAFQLHKGGDGNWQVASVRLADGRWEDVEMLRRALDSEKALRAAADIRALAAGVEAYRLDRGYFPQADTVAALVDRISPAYAPKVIRVDPWGRSYTYALGASGYRLGSPGPDGVAGTADDVVLDGGGR